MLQLFRNVLVSFFQAPCWPHGIIPLCARIRHCPGTPSTWSAYRRYVARLPDSEALSPQRVLHLLAGHRSCFGLLNAWLVGRLVFHQHHPSRQPFWLNVVCPMLVSDFAHGKPLIFHMLFERDHIVYALYCPGDMLTGFPLQLLLQTASLAIFI